MHNNFYFGYKQIHVVQYFLDVEYKQIHWNNTLLTLNTNRWEGGTSVCVCVYIYIYTHTHTCPPFPPVGIQSQQRIVPMYLFVFNVKEVLHHMYLFVTEVKIIVHVYLFEFKVKPSIVPMYLFVFKVKQILRLCISLYTHSKQYCTFVSVCAQGAQPRRYHRSTSESMMRCRESKMRSRKASSGTSCLVGVFSKASSGRSTSESMMLL